jgi:hypothetical protein
VLKDTANVWLRSTVDATFEHRLYDFEIEHDATSRVAPIVYGGARYVFGTVVRADASPDGLEWVVMYDDRGVGPAEVSRPSRG